MYDKGMGKGMKMPSAGRPRIPAGKPSGMGSMSRKVDQPPPRAAVGSARISAVPPQSRKTAGR